MKKGHLTIYLNLRLIGPPQNKSKYENYIPYVSMHVLDYFSKETEFLRDDLKGSVKIWTLRIPTGKEKKKANTQNDRDLLVGGRYSMCNTLHLPSAPQHAQTNVECRNKIQLSIT